MKGFSRIVQRAYHSLYHATQRIDRAYFPSKTKRDDFSEEKLLWVDRESFEDELSSRLASNLLTEKEADAVRHYRKDGFLILRNAIEEDLIDTLWEDYEKAWKERPALRALVQEKGVTDLVSIDRDQDLNHHHFRLMDFHNLSEAGSHIMLHPTIIHLMKIIFDDIPVGMQSLLFEYGSEQDIHQDFAFVKSGILSHLAAVWVACEDIDSENGPLLYYPGSHRISKFDFGGGSCTYDADKPYPLEEYKKHMCKECERLGISSKSLKAQKGDVFLWHGTLVHGGGQVIDHERTRKSFVCHYSSCRAYPRDRRNLLKVPQIVSRNSGMYYKWDYPGHIENRYRLHTSVS